MSDEPKVKVKIFFEVCCFFSLSFVPFLQSFSFLPPLLIGINKPLNVIISTKLCGVRMIQGYISLVYNNGRWVGGFIITARNEVGAR